MSPEPNVNFGTPVVFFDSHPEEQDTVLSSYWTALKGQLHTAWTGIVPKFHAPGQLRLIWYLREEDDAEGGAEEEKEGMRDYELHQYALVRECYESLLAMPAVRRVLVMGYSGQNPYVLGPAGEKNLWAQRFAAEKRQGRRRQVDEKAGVRQMQVESESVQDKNQRMDEEREGRMGRLVDIDAVLEKSERADEERRREQEERVWKENESLLSGEMV